MSLEQSCKQQLATMCKNLTILRQERNLTIEEVSQQTDVPKNILHDLEKGVTKRFHAGHLIRLSQFYHVLPSILLEEFPDNPAAHREY